MPNPSNPFLDSNPEDPTIGSVLRAAISSLRASGCDNPFLDAGLLLAYTLDKNLEYVLGYKEVKLDERLITRFADLLKRRVGREPMSHILGYREFYGLRFHVTKDTLDPRPDSEILIDAVLTHHPKHEKPLHILDLGVGSGCLLLTLLKHYDNYKGLGVDISEEALMVAKQNADSLGVSSRATLMQSDWLESVSGMFDIIIANPPYIALNDFEGLAPEVRVFEPRTALTDEGDGYDSYRLIACSLAPHIHPYTRIYFEIGMGQKEIIVSIMQAYDFNLEASFKDLNGIERCLLFEVKKQK